MCDRIRGNMQGFFSPPPNKIKLHRHRKCFLTKGETLDSYKSQTLPNFGTRIPSSVVQKCNSAAISEVKNSENLMISQSKNTSV